MKERLQYIDVCRGLLMLLVILLHIPSAMGNTNPLWKFMQQIDYVYSSFFMACFFVLTGYCSSLDQIKVRMWLRTLIVPALLLGLINSWLPLLIVGDFRLSSWLHFGLKHILVYGSIYWFISAMFLDRVLMAVVFTLVRYDWCRWCVVILLSIVGFWLYDGTDDLTNIWCFKHALCLLPFMYLGGRIRGTEHLRTLCYVSLVVYGILIFVCAVLGINVPRFTWTIICAKWQMPIWYACACFGSLGLLGVAMLIRRNVVLEYLGRGSLVVYCLHTVFLVVCARVINSETLAQLPMIASVVLFAFIFGGAVAWSMAFVWLFDRPKLLWITGR